MITPKNEGDHSDNSPYVNPKIQLDKAIMCSVGTDSKNGFYLSYQKYLAVKVKSRPDYTLAPII